MRRRVVFVMLALLAVVAFVAGLDHRTRYVAAQAPYQLELLWGRVPVEDAVASGSFTDDELKRLALVDEIKAYGQRIQLESTANYSTINPEFRYTIWNVSASERTRFRNVSYWFPIVGRVPYLGFFEEAEAVEAANHLKARGYDVYRRTAGAYSTLGWFEDPLLPGMLTWDEDRLADTLLHELAHATLWVPGSVRFNESFANFVGEEAALRYLVDKYGEDSPEVTRLRDKRADRLTFRALMHGVYKELDTVYDDDRLSDTDKLRRKGAVLNGLGERVQRANLRRTELYRTAVKPGSWNNARLMQFKTYNHNRERFAALLAQEDGDLRAFIGRIDEITAGADNPFQAVEDATAGLLDAAAEQDVD